MLPRQRDDPALLQHPLRFLHQFPSVHPVDGRDRDENIHRLVGERQSHFVHIDAREVETVGLGGVQRLGQANRRLTHVNAGHLGGGEEVVQLRKESL